MTNLPSPSSPAPSLDRTSPTAPAASTVEALLARSRGVQVQRPATPIHQLVLAQIARTPNAVAVTFGEQSQTYAQLERRSAQIGAAVMAAGGSKGARVAVSLWPCLDVPAALLGVLRAGAAYVPVDPEAPVDRLRFILADARASVVITSRALAHLWVEASVPVLILEDLAGDGAASFPEVSPQALAYVVYTSGSTGEPKGVLIPHAALVNHSTDMAERMTLSPEDRILQFTPIYFDAAGEEIYPPLLAGSTVAVRGELVPCAEFRELILRERLTVLSLPPAYLHEWLAELERLKLQVPECLRLVILGGEKILPESWATWHRVGGGAIPWMNVYGPSETTITASTYRITREGTGISAPVLPIGTPISNVEAYLLDEDLAPVPDGEPGEIFLGGPGVAWGYLNRPDLTAEKFVPHPFSATPGARLYRTGDLGRYLPGRGIEFISRVDHQVKLRGFRIELGEIESVLRKIPAVQEAVAVVVGEDAARRLVAYVLPKTGRQGELPNLKAHVAEHLPAYMVPSAFVLLETLPLTANGKVDRKALPPPPADHSAGAPDTPPRSDTEKALAQIWSEVLGVESPGAFANFFDVGGHSLAALQVLSRVSESFGVELEMRQVFDAPTIAAFAEQIELAAAMNLPADVAAVDQMSDEQVEAMLRQLQQAARKD